MTDKEIWKLHNESMNEYYEDQQKKENKALKQVKEIVNNDRRYQRVLDYIEELREDGSELSDFSVENEFEGDRQSVSYWFRNEFVNQYSVGESGDSFSGNIGIKIANNKYLVINFSI